MIYGYARVSSKSQEDKYGLEVQHNELKHAGVEKIYTDVFTGTTMHRPNWEVLVSKLEADDTLVCVRLDRIARTAIDGCIAVRDLVERGVTVRVLNMGTIENTPMGRMILAVMFAMAEYDRDMIVERLADGKAVARTKPGYREGRKPKKIDEELLVSAFQKVLSGEISKREAARQLGVGDATFRRRMEKYNVA